MARFIRRGVRRHDGLCGASAGLATTLTVAIATQIVAAILLDHFGLLGLRIGPVTTGWLVGAGLMLVGVVLVRRG